MISILSFYGAFTGYRSLYRKQPARGDGPIWLDWMGAGIASVAGLAWVLPALIGTPLIARTIRYYRQKFESRRVLHSAPILTEVG